MKTGRSPSWAWGVLAALASGGLMSACYWPLNLHFLAWIALVPWLIVLPRLRPDRAWLFGTLVGLVFYRAGLAWLCTLSGPLGVAAVIGLALWMGFSFRVARLLMDRLSGAAMMWIVPLAFVGQEVVRCEGLAHYRFAYLAWGYSQSHNIWIAQIASIGGVYFVSFLLVAFNAAVAHGLIHRRVRSWLPMVGIATVTILLGFISQPAGSPSGRQVTVACVQAETTVYDEYLQLATEATNYPDKPAFVVLPEHAIYDYADERHPTIRALAELARDKGVYICIGVHTRAEAGAACDYDNVALLIDTQGHIVGRQAKSVPVPFFDDGNPARSQETVETPWGRTGTYICYDATFTDLPRRLVDLGAELLLAPLMDPEPWPVQQRWQHADIAPVRSIELRRCAVRAASSGVSQIIDATGHVRRQRTREQGPGVICGPVEFCAGRTPFVRGGHLFATAVGAAFLLAVIGLTLADWWGKVRRRRGGPRSSDAVVADDPTATSADADS